MGTGSNLRIVSLLPRLTEITVALSFENNLVGHSHECDFPDFVKNLPFCSEPKFKITKQTKSADIDKSVYIRDGHKYFNRPGPRLADSAEILAEILQPAGFDFRF